MNRNIEKGHTYGFQNCNYSPKSPIVLPGQPQTSEQVRLYETESPNSVYSPGHASPHITNPSNFPPVIEPLKLQALKFTGQEETYRSFRARISRVMKKIDEDLQIEYLIQCLDGEALRLAMMVDFEDPKALQLIWLNLDERFSNDTALYCYHSKRLQSLASYPQCQTEEDLKELYYFCKETISALRCYSKNSTAGEDFKNLICEVLPYYLRKKVIKVMYKNPSQFTLDHLLTMVGEQVGQNNMQKIIERRKENSGEFLASRENIGKQAMTFINQVNQAPVDASLKVPPRPYSSSYESHHRHISTTRPVTEDSHIQHQRFCRNEALSTPCIFCGEHHMSRDCKLFQTGQQFSSLLQVQRRCYNCFSIYHQVHYCPHRSSCTYRRCKRKSKHSPFVCKFRPVAVIRETESCESEVSATTNQLESPRVEIKKEIEIESKESTVTETTSEQLTRQVKQLIVELSENKEMINSTVQEKDKLAAQLKEVEESLVDLSKSVKEVGHIMILKERLFKEKIKMEDINVKDYITQKYRLLLGAKRQQRMKQHHMQPLSIESLKSLKPNARDLENVLERKHGIVQKLSTVIKENWASFIFGNVNKFEQEVFMKPCNQVKPLEIKPV